jgi:hypothetical protein
MKKTILLASFIFFLCIVSRAQSPIKRQIHIPLDNLKGIPYTFSEMNYYVDGFDVDGEGNYYFLNNENGFGTLAKFSGAHQEYRKKSKAYIGNQFYISGDNVLFLNYFSKGLAIFNLNGTFVKNISHFTKQNINSSRFQDSLLILDVMNEKATLNYYLYSQSGEFIRKVNNAFALPANVIIKDQAITGVIYLGKWDNEYVFWYIDDKRNGYEKFWIANNTGKIIKTVYYKTNMLGSTFENPGDYTKIKNNSIYILRHNAETGIITELSLKDMFN